MIGYAGHLLGKALKGGAKQVWGGAAYGAAVSGATGENVLQGALYGGIGAGVGRIAGAGVGKIPGSFQRGSPRSANAAISKSGRWAGGTNANIGAAYRNAKTNVPFASSQWSGSIGGGGISGSYFSSKGSAISASMKMSTLSKVAGSMIGHSFQDKSNNTIGSNSGYR